MSFTARAGKAQQFKDVIVGMMHATAVEDGCIMYRYTQDLESDQVFHLVELWESEEKMQAHIDAPHSARFVVQLPDLAEITSVRANEGEMRKFRVPAPNT